jgi:type II secretory ATPase GspE/PulE/Tfp pilus assembly ATPase PilB-like protein
MGFINTEDMKIWTAEDPVEITQYQLRQVQIQHKIGLDFARAMRAFLRADPDVIMVGEMRDKETAAMGIEASLTGHLVMSTLHTNSAPETIVRLIDMGLDPFNFADALLGVLAQRLAKTLCGCAEVYPLEKKEFEELVTDYGKEDYKRCNYGPKDYQDPNWPIKMKKRKGCPKCNNSGCKGRIGIHELLVNSDKIKTIIQGHGEGKVDALREAAIAGGMSTLKQDGILKVFQGYTDIQNIRAVCMK